MTVTESKNPDLVDDTPRDAMAPLDSLPDAAFLRRVDEAVGLVERAVLAALLVGLIAIGAGQAVGTKLGMAGGWSFELIRFGVFFIAMTGAALSAQTEQLIAMDFVTRLLSPRSCARLRVVLRLFTLAACYLLIIGGLAYRESTRGDPYDIIPPPLGLLALPVGAGLIGFHVAVHLVIDGLYLARGLTPPEPRQQAVH